MNRATHDYPGAQAARLAGWRRVWVHVATRPVAYLSVRPAPGTKVLGMVAEVPGGDWAALDRREAAYSRHGVSVEAGGAALPAQVYAVPAAVACAPDTAHPVLLSYLDAVVQGFLREFGEDGVQDFFDTTEGWGAPVLDDRAVPRYPRAQELTRAERAAVEAGLAQVGARIIRPA